MAGIEILLVAVIAFAAGFIVGGLYYINKLQRETMPLIKESEDSSKKAVVGLFVILREAKNKLDEKDQQEIDKKIELLTATLG